MAVATDDVVRSRGRIQVLQAGRMRFIEFGSAKVLEVDAIGITVNPLGKRAIVTCRPDDLELIEHPSNRLQQTPVSRTSGEQVAEANKPEPVPEPMVPVPEPVPEPAPAAASAKGSIDVTGEVADEDTSVSKEVVKKAEKARSKPSLKQIKQRKEAEQKVKPKPKPAPKRRRDR